MSGAVINNTVVGGDQGTAANSSQFLLMGVLRVEKCGLRFCKYHLSLQNVWFLSESRNSQKQSKWKYTSVHWLVPFSVIC